MDGFINVFKQPGITSTQIITKLKREVNDINKIGHTGTLDPEAAGVLPVCVGNATRLADYVMVQEKAYRFEMTFGIETDTLDAEGKSVKKSDVIPSEKEVQDALKEFEGDIEQIPPMFSAIHYNGKRLYQLAREGKVIDVEPRKVSIKNLSLVRQTSLQSFLIDVECSKGTYVRSLCRDIAYKLNSVGFISFLLRTKTGVFSIEEAKPFEEIVLQYRNQDRSFLIDLDKPIEYLPRIDVDKRYMSRLTNGNSVPFNKQNESYELFRIYCDKCFIGLGKVNDNSIKIKKMLYKKI